MKKTVKAAAPQAAPQRCGCGTEQYCPECEPHMFPPPIAPRPPELRAKAALLSLQMMHSDEARLSFLTALLSEPARTASAPKKSNRKAQP